MRVTFDQARCNRGSFIILYERLLMDYLHITTLVYSLAYAQGASPKLTLPNPIYYLNDSIRLSCDSVISADLIAVDIRINKTDTDINYFIVCRYRDGKWIAPTVTGPIYDDNCVNLPNSGSVNLGISIRMVERMKSSSVTCEVSYFEGGVKTVQDVKANAFSEAYEVRSKSDAIVSNITELKDDKAVEFIINDQLKTGFSVTCRDKVHTRRTISLTKQNCTGPGSDLCMPHYIISKVPSSNIVSFNPNYSNTVECDVEGYPTNKIIYTWTSDGKVLPSENAATYIIPADIQKRENTEILSCTATHDTYGIVNITWTIAWSFHATTESTATKSAATDTSSASTAIGVGVGVGIAIVAIGITLGIILHKKRKEIHLNSCFKDNLHQSQHNVPPSNQQELNRSRGVYDDVINPPKHYEKLDFLSVPESSNSHDYQTVVMYENLASKGKTN